MTLNALSRKSNWCQRVFDLVRYAPRYLPPSCLLLCPEQVRQVFKDQHVSQALGGVAQRRDGYCDIQLRSRQGQLHGGGRDTHTIGSPEKRLQVRKHVGRYDIAQRLVDECGRTHIVFALQVKQTRESCVRKGHMPRRVDRNHPCGNALQNGLDVAASTFQGLIRCAHIST